MCSRLLPVAVVLPACVLFLIPSPDAARGCAIAPPRGYQVDVNAEQAVILWNAATKTEHFIRAASFTSTSADFGFLVPTPTKPELAEADAGVFAALGEWTKARTVYEKQIIEYDADGGGCSAFGPKSAAPAAGAKAEAMPDSAPRSSVTVLGKSKVGGYDAVSLKADDAEELRKWLEKNGYDARAELTGWFKWYTDNKWVITAFKIAADDPAGPAPANERAGATARTAKSQAVRMTFKTEKPFYPYREPADARAAPANGHRPRTLKVFFASDARYAGSLGTDAQGWPGRPVWAGELAGSELRQSKIADATKRSWHLTEFVDESSPRPGTDEVYFSKADDQSTLERPPHVVYVPEYRERASRGWGYEIIAALVAAPILALLLGLIAWRLLRPRA